MRISHEEQLRRRKYFVGMSLREKLKEEKENRMKHQKVFKEDK